MRIQQDSSDRRSLLRSASSGSESDVEAQSRRERHKEPRELDRRKTVRRLSSSSSPSSSSNHAVHRRPSISQVRERVTEKVPPEWALLLVGCLLGLTTGLCVVAFNRGVHFIHDWAWAGTPHEGAAWLRLQRLADTWHRIMLIPVTGGVIVGVMHTMLAIIDQIITSRPPEPRRLDVLAGLCPTIKATQAAVTLGTGCSLGPEGPSVDIGKSCAIGYSELMKNDRQRKIALLAAGAAAGISSGFNAAVSGCFFAIETVLRPLHAENSPPLTTAMIILASVLSSTVSNTLLGERPAFIVPTYELKSAAELPLYLILGMVCGVVSVVFTRLVTWFTSVFDFIKERFGIPATVTPALGGLGVGIIALKYPGVLYWGFTNVDEILHAGKTASSPGISLLTQLVAAKVVATALCKGSGLVGGIYAPSLMIGSAVGAVFGDLAGKAINAAIPGHAAVAHPQAYALVGMAATLASACSVPLTSVLLLFELTKDYHILLPLMGAVGLAFWVAAVANQKKPSQGTEKSSLLSTFGGYTRLTKEDTHSPRSHRVWRKGEDNEVELCTIDGLVGPEMVSEEELLESIKVSQAMSKDFVKVSDTTTIKEAVAAMLEAQQRCVLVVDENDLLEGIMTLSDLQHETLRAAMATSQGDPTILDASSTLVAAVCTTERSRQGNKRDLVVCYPDTDLKSAQRLFAVKGVKQLPVVSRGEKRWQDGGRKLVALLHQEAITACLRKEATKRVMLINSHARSEDDEDISFGH